MNTKKIALAIITCCFLLTALSSKADVIYVYGLTNTTTGKIEDNTVEGNLRNSLKIIVGNKHEIIFDDNRSLVNKGNYSTYGSADILKRTASPKHADYIIFFGHGLSSSGSIYDDYYDIDPSKNPDSIFSPLKDFLYHKGWTDIKGVLIFACSVIDIGDFGWQRLKKEGFVEYCDANCSSLEGCEGNYCLNPNPGLQWEELARRNNINYILGFNYMAPLLKNSGDKLVENFFSTWMKLEENSPADENFLKAWKGKVLIDKAKLIERGYIEKIPSGDYNYSMGRANNYDNDKELYWPENWQFAWENKKDKNGQDYFLPKWPAMNANGKFASSMSVDNYYRIILYPSCNFKDVTKKEQPILYYNLRNLCTKKIVSGRDMFYPTVNAKLEEISKMIVKAANIKKYSGDQDPEGFKCKNISDCGYIKDLFAEKIIESEIEMVIPLLVGKIKEIDPNEEVDRGKFIKMIMMAFFKHFPEKPYDCSSITTTDSRYVYFCQYFLAAKKCNLLFRDEDKSVFGITNGKIDPKQKIKRSEAAILIDRARILKETGVEQCLPE